ncbi:hypothetical protein CGZ75_15160 [Paenibacillus herberti]|uniref:Uncharacterized protein n=1 Tax=Paenibacillus herberti TaxID=1619309 RepID=A0A229NWM1_9BACL|nr:hypothetical protein CGZ75_15160 [Paenibacillus herberti]
MVKIKQKVSGSFRTTEGARLSARSVVCFDDHEAGAGAAPFVCLSLVGATAALIGLSRTTKSVSY